MTGLEEGCYLGVC